MSSVRESAQVVMDIIEVEEWCNDLIGPPGEDDVCSYADFNKLMKHSRVLAEYILDATKDK